jgi:hypothetical protein
VAIGIGLVFAERAGLRAVSHRELRARAVRRRLRHVGLGVVPLSHRLLNIVILAGIMKVFRSMRDGTTTRPSSKRSCRTAA